MNKIVTMIIAGAMLMLASCQQQSYPHKHHHHYHAKCVKTLGSMVK